MARRLVGLLVALTAGATVVVQGAAVPATLPSGPVARPPAQDLDAPLDFRARRLDGSDFDARELRGKLVLLDFWAVWCPPCIGAFPELSELAEELGDRPFELVGVTVHSGSPEDVREVLRDHDVRYTVVVADNDLTYEFGVIGYPTYLLIDPEGRVHRKYVGAPPGLKERMKADIIELAELSGLAGSEEKGEG